MNLCFTSLEADHRVMLDRWIAELSGEAPLPFEQHHHAEEPAAETVVDPSEACPENNDPALVGGELIIALMRRWALSPEEGNSLLCKLTTKTCPTR